jgi:hypothetical protein
MILCVLIREKRAAVTARGKYKINTPYFDIGDNVVWGATAMMLSELSIIVGKTGILKKYSVWSILAEPLITNDAVAFGMLMVLLAFVFKTSNSDNTFWTKFYKVIPMLLLCYFLPSILTTAGIIAPYWYDHALVIEFLQGKGSKRRSGSRLEAIVAANCR